MSQTAGAGRAFSISSVLQGAGEREKTRDKETREIWTDPSWCTQNNLAPPLLSNCHNTNQLPSSSGAELSLLAQIESGGAFISAGGANNPMITWPVQKELQQTGGYSVNRGDKVGMARYHWMLFLLLFVRHLPFTNENRAPGNNGGNNVLCIGGHWQLSISHFEKFQKFQKFKNLKKFQNFKNFKNFKTLSFFLIGNCQFLIFCYCLQYRGNNVLCTGASSRK